MALVSGILTRSLRSSSLHLLPARRILQQQQQQNHLLPYPLTQGAIRLAGNQRPIRSLQPDVHFCTQVNQENAAFGERAFDYCALFRQKLDEKRKDNSYRIFRKVNRSAELFPVADEHSVHPVRRVTIWCSNDYLGLTRHPKVQEAVIQAVRKHGVGAGGSRNIAGNSPYHEELEQELASLHRKPAALLFTSGFVANDSTLYTLAKTIPGCVIHSDSGNHGSMIHGIRNSGVAKRIFRHNDVHHLRSLLAAEDGHRSPKIIAFETIHSMTGSVSPLREICQMSREFGALTFVDEVHAVGLYGQSGAGMGEMEDVLDHMDIVSGTLGKAIGNVGGYIAGPAELIDMIRSYAAGFIFTTSLPPTVVCGSLAALKILKSDEGRCLRHQMHANVAYLRQSLKEAQLPVIDNDSHIVPIHVGDSKLVFRVASDLLEKHGMYIQPINYPSVPRGQELLRAAPTSVHTVAMIDQFVEALQAVWRENQIPTSTAPLGRSKPRPI